MTSLAAVVASLSLGYVQFAILADKILGRPELSSDPRFSSNSARVMNRDALITIISETLMKQTRDHWLQYFSGLGYIFTSSCLFYICTGLIIVNSVPFGPINNIEQTFEHPQAKARNLVVEVEVCLFRSDT